MKKSLFAFAALVLSQSVGLAAQAPEPKNLQCVVKEIEMYETRVEEVVSEKTIVPKLEEANRHGTDSETIFKRGNIKIDVELSYLDYTPLVTTLVKVGSVVVQTGLTASVTDPKSGNQIVATCSYEQGEEEQ